MAFNETPNLLERTGTVSHFLFGVQFSCTVMEDMQVLDICNDKILGSIIILTLQCYNNSSIVS